MILGWKNRLDDPLKSIAVSGTGWVQDLPLENMLVDPLGRVARTTGAGPATTLDIFWPGMTLRVLGLLNADAGGKLITLRLTVGETAFGDTDMYDSGTLTRADLKLREGYAQIYFVVPPLGLGAGEGDGYIRLTLTKAESIDIGRLVLYGPDDPVGLTGGFWEPPRNYAHGAGLTWDDPSPVLETLGGQEVARGAPRRRRFDFDLPNNARDGMLDNIFELDRIAGTTGNILVMLDPVNRPVEQSLWGRLEVSTPLIESRGRMGKRFIVRERL
jgi:hypothetical protein